MKKSLRLILSIYILMVSSFETKALGPQENSYLKEGFELALTRDRTNFSLVLKKNYLQFREGFEESGFYLKSCNKRIVASLEHSLSERLGKFFRENMAAETVLKKQATKENKNGLLKVNDRVFPLFERRSLQPSAYRLARMIRDHIEKGRQLCAPKS